ncbi:ABC transporter permease [Streptomyces sp. DSM 44915]|uniref:ABC transporter permease n=1 Tax=Streptomyces chisholmiae TaxID=3075540 RepID=A0ABU2JTI3_9ACTN|nr:ABC transporter permease [Streptomyces sp. DSM 44915]MDT0268300.1 ABC transporter permease [Streptomyces sp. DSM 44915]
MSTPARLSPTPRPDGPSGARPLLLVIIGVPLLIGFVLWAFAWPSARSEPHQLPVGLVGSSAEATALAGERLAGQGDAFEVREYQDEAAARRAIEEREVYGAFVLTDTGQPEVLTASAGGAAVSQLLVGAAQAQAPDGVQVTVTDVVPAPAGDPRGAAFGASLLPLVMAGIATGALLTVSGLRGGRALAALLGAAVLAGSVATLIARDWLGALAGDWWQVAGVLGLLVAAGGATVAGLAALLGRAGIGVGALLLMLLGNPWSGAASAPELLPVPVGDLGQLLPAGAGASLLRSVAFFDGHAAGFPLLVLFGWLALGAAAVLVGGRRAGAASAARPAGAAVPAAAPAPAG